jgi:hypothetical protein
MNRMRILLTAGILTVFAAAAMAESTNSPLHNPILGLDVDGNSTIEARDAELLIGLLLQPGGGGGPVEPFTAFSEPAYYWDTTNDSRVSALDALAVISYLTTTVPEPGTFVLAAAGFPVLAAYLWRKRRRA